MKILDAQGRLFGKISVLDLGALLVMLLVAIGLLLPAASGVAQSTTKPVEVDVIVRNFSTTGPKSPLQPGAKTNLIIRNQPFGQVEVKSVKELPRTLAVPQPDGNVKVKDDPRPETAFSRDFLVTLKGDAQIREDGPVLGSTKVKIGTKIELEGFNYDLVDLGVLDVRVKE